MAKGDISMEKITINIQELAKHLNVGRNTAYNLTRRTGFPCVMIGKRKIIPLKALNEWLTEEAKKRNDESL